jgi:CTP synthase
VEFARHVLGEPDATSTEFNPETLAPVISLLSEQERVVDRGGTMRLGHYPCALRPGTRASAAYSVAQVEERHRHRWEFNNRYREPLESAGLIASGLSPDGRLVEIAELRDHPFMMGSQFHPELRSRPGRPHPLFEAFMDAALAGQSTPDGAGANIASAAGRS